MIEKEKTFKGGYPFGSLQGRPSARISHVGIPMRVAVPLLRGCGDVPGVVVKTGDSVMAGQIIAIDDNAVCSPVHSSVNGVVIDCETSLSGFLSDGRAIHGRSVSGARSGEYRAVTIESDGTSGWLPLGDSVAGLDLSGREGVFKALYMSGVSALGRSGIPTPYNSSQIGIDGVKNIVIDGTSSEPLSLPSEAFLGGDCRPFITGLNILNLLYPDADIDVALDSNDRETLYRLSNALEVPGGYAERGDFATGRLSNCLYIHPLKPKYPQSDESLLVETLLGKIPAGKADFAAIEYGVVILDVRDIISIYEAVVDGKPLIESLVALGGTGFSVNHCASVRIGTSLKSVIAHRHRYGIESRIIINSMVNGAVVESLDMPIDSATSSILAIPENREQEFLAFLRPGIERGSFSNTFLSLFFSKRARRCDTNLNGEPRACIACNYCEYICPVDIMPFLINKYVTHDMAEEAVDMNIFDCIECGLCSYVCPSKISILQNIQKGKDDIRADMSVDGAE